MSQLDCCFRKIIIGLLCFPWIIMSQEKPNPAELFEDSFFESLKHKGIENYDKAITSLEKCLEIEPQNAAVYYEIGRNQLLQKKYLLAQQAFQKSRELDGFNTWTLVGLYDVYYEIKDFNQAITIVQELVKTKPKYKEDLASLYMYTKQYDKALALIKMLDDEVGTTVDRDAYKRQIFMDAKYSESEKVFLQSQIKKFPKIESNYVSLIYLYSESNQEDKAFETAKKLESNIPSSEWAQVGLFKFYINNNQGIEAVEAMRKVLKNASIHRQIRYKLLNEFLIYTINNPEFDSYLRESIVDLPDEKEKALLSKDIAIFLQQKNRDQQAVFYFQTYLEIDPADFQNQLLFLQSLYKLEDYPKIAYEAEMLLEKYPLQPDLYYLAGLSNNKLTNYKKAKSLLEEGLEYLIDKTGLEINFYLEIIESCKQLNDTECIQKMNKKIASLR